MAYKIIKYGGKHKIKDVKTGKSVDIDIEKYMNGGEKEVTKYSNGGECPPWDIECQQRNGMMPPPVSSELEGYVPQMPGNPNLNDLRQDLDYDSIQNNGSPIVEENTRPKVEALDISGLKTAGVHMPKMEITAPDISDTLARTTNLNPDNNVTSEKSDQLYNIPNPYAGVDIPTAANHLGQSIENKSALGIAASSLKILTGLGRNVVSGLGHQNRYNQVMKDYYTEQKNKKNPVQYLAHGGKRDEELATGEYMHGISNENTEEFNAEIEQGEYFQSNEGDIAEVVGDKHSKGGEKIQMEAEDRVLSDELKLGGKTAKMLSEKYDLKLKAKHTYSDVLDKFRKKMKLDKLVEEESDIIKKIGEQSDVEDATTRDLNLQVLTQKKKDIEEEKHPIEEQRKVVFDELFSIQEETKPKDKKSEDTFEYGGKLEALASEYNIPLNRAKELVQEFAKGGKMVPKYAKGDCGPGTVWDEELQKCVPVYGDEALSSISGAYSNDPKYKYKDLANQSERIAQFAQEYGVDMKEHFGGKEGDYTQQELDKFAGVLQNKVIQDNPELARHYGTNVAPTANGLNYLLDKGLPKELVGSLVNKEGKIKSGTREGSLSADQISKITDWAKGNLDEGTVDEFAKRNFNDNKWYYRYPEKKNIYYKDKDKFDAAVGSDRNLGNFNLSTDKTGLYTSPYLLQDKTFETQEELDAFVAQNKDRTDKNHEGYYGTEDDDHVFYNPIVKEQQKQEAVEPGVQVEEEDRARLAGMYLFPNESPLPPSALQGTIKAERRFDRVRPSEIDAEPYLQDIKDREEAQVQSLEGLSPNVRAAVLANMRGNSQKAESNVRNQIDTQNIQSQEKAIYTNAQIQQREENASEKDRLAYEGRQYRAQALTDNDLNGYFNQLQSINKQRFMDIHNLNLINATNEDVYFDGQGYKRKNSDRDILRQVKV